MQRRNSMMSIGAVLLTFACGESTGLEVQDLQGTWAATEYTFVNPANTTQTVDLITVNGASFDMTVLESGTVSTVFDDGVGGTSSNSGTLSTDGSSLTVAGDSYSAARSGDLLTLTDNASEYDFDADGSDDPATLRIQLQRQ